MGDLEYPGGSNRIPSQVQDLGGPFQESGEGNQELETGHAVEMNAFQQLKPEENQWEYQK
jgi:hypothetical protein